MIWEFTRATALTSYILFFISISLGIIISYGYLQKKTFAFTSLFHKYAGFSGIILVLAHMISLLFDSYVPFTLKELFIPFTSSYKTLEIGFGVLGFYGFTLVILSSSFMFLKFRNSHKKIWRGIHILSYPAFILSLYHGLIAGTDSSSIIVQNMYYCTGIIPLILISLRIFFVKKER